MVNLFNLRKKEWFTVPLARASIEVEDADLFC